MQRGQFLMNALLVAAIVAGVGAGFGVRTLTDPRPTAEWRRAQHEAYVQRLLQASSDHDIGRTAVQ